MVGGAVLPVLDLHNPGKALGHDGHVRSHDRVAEAPKLLLVLLAHALLELLLGDPVGLEERAHPEERPEEGVSLHAQLKLRLVRRLAGDIEARQDEDPDIVVLHELPVAGGNPLPGGLRGLARLPNEAAPLLEALEGVRVGERLRVAAQDNVDVIELAVHLDGRRGDREVIVGRGPLLLGAVLRVRHHVEPLNEEPVGVVHGIPLGNVPAEFADQLTQVLARCDHAPPANGMESHGDRPLRQQRGGVLADDSVGMLHAEHEEGLAVVGAPAVAAARMAGGELVGPERVLRPEVARADPVGPPEEARRFGGREAGQRTPVPHHLVGLS